MSDLRGALVIGLENAAGAGAQIALGCVFGYSALRKAVPHHSLRPTLSALGIPPKPARVGAYAMVVVEAGAAVAVLAAPGQAWVYALVIALAGSFAFAGAAALATGRDVPCRCLGVDRDGRLGWRQIAALPVWVAGCVIAGTWVSPWPAEVGLALASALVASVGALYVKTLIRLRRQLRWDRLATPA